MCFARAPHDPFGDQHDHRHGHGDRGCPCPDGGDVMIEARRPDILDVIMRREPYEDYAREPYSVVREQLAD